MSSYLLVDHLLFCGNYSPNQERMKVRFYGPETKYILIYHYDNTIWIAEQLILLYKNYKIIDKYWVYPIPFPL